MILLPSSKAGGSSWKTFFIILAVLLGGYIYHELTLDPKTDIGYLCKTQAYVKVHKQVPVSLDVHISSQKITCDTEVPGKECFIVTDFGTRARLGIVGSDQRVSLPTGERPGLLSLSRTYSEYRDERTGELLAETLDFASVKQNWFPLMHPLNSTGCIDRRNILNKTLFVKKIHEHT